MTNGIKLTPRERQVLDVLTIEPLSAYEIARRANITTVSRSETAAKFCIALVKKGLAVKSGWRQYPKWARVYPKEFPNDD